MAEHVAFPEKYDYAARFVDRKYMPLETAPGLEDMQKLALYALRRQVVDGPCKESAPYMWNVKERFKHNAWCQLGSMSRVEAMVNFASFLDTLAPGWLAEQYAFEHPEATTATSSSAATAGSDSGSAGATEPPSAPVRASALAHGLTSAEGHDVSRLNGDHARHALMTDNAVFDDVSLSDDVTPENVRKLIDEVIRLRQMLMHNGIDYTNSAPEATPVGGFVASTASSSSGRIAAATNGRPWLAHTSRPRTSVAVPGRLASRPRAAALDSPVGPAVPSTELGATDAAADVPAQPRGWLAWLGLGGGQDGVPRTV